MFACVIVNRDNPFFYDYNLFYIDDICVLEKHRRKGIGRSLLDACKAAAKEHGCKTMDLGVWSFNRDAIMFYENYGMRERTRKMEYVIE